MGDGADRAIEAMEDEAIERANQAMFYYQFDDQELIRRVKANGFYKSRKTKMIKAICKLLVLTKSQRHSLIYYIVDDPAT